MDDALLDTLAARLAGLEFPADTDEVVAHLLAAGCEPALIWLVQAVPGRTFGYASDLLATARIALEMRIREPWPPAARAHGGHVGEATLVDEVTARLRLCPRTNARLIRVTAGDGTIYLDGRARDVPEGVMATKVAGGVVADWRVVNRLDVRA